MSEVNPYLVAGITNLKEQQLMKSKVKAAQNELYMTHQTSQGGSPPKKDPLGESPVNLRKGTSNPQGSPRNANVIVSDRVDS